MSASQTPGPLAKTDHPEDIDLTPVESLAFWALLAVALFAVTGFCAGLLYPFFP